MPEECDDERVENRRMLLIILSSIRFLGRKGLALEGHYKTGDEYSMEFDSNFLQLRHVLRILQLFLDG